MTAAILNPSQEDKVAQSGPLRVALVGNPNAGKSTLFNALTGLRQHVANFPGVTVERVEGEYLYDGRRMTVTDLPGTYSLAPQSLDERIAIDVLLGRARGVRPADVIVLVLDAENLERHLFFASEVLELGRPTVVALNRMDRLPPGTRIDIPELIHELGAVVLPIVASRGEGVDALRRAIAIAPTLPLPPRSLVVEAGAPARYSWIAGVVDRCIERPAGTGRRLGDRVDGVALHPVWGPLIFLGIMLLLFQTMFTWSRPLIDAVQWAVTGVGLLATTVVPPGELRSLLADGVVAGVGNVLVFLPQIAILFLFIGILEDTGYMARAAFVMDRFMRPVGLHGRSFIPLLSGYACAVPAILATRTIKDQKQRLATVMVVPMISCSARLPVYALLIGAFVPPTMMLHGMISLQGMTLLAMYLLGTVGALGMAALFRRTLLRAPTRALILELPAYSVPNVRVLAMSVWQRVRIFLRRAGTVILAASVLLWALAHYPRSDATTADARLAQSALGRVGHAIEPAMRPLGYDWKISVSILSSFAAREVFVSAMSTIYGVEDTETNRTTLLRERLRGARNESGGLAYTPVIALGLMAFYVFALMCTSTVAVTIRECGGGWVGVGWAVLQFAYMLTLAYGVAWLVHHVGLVVGGLSR